MMTRAGVQRLTVKKILNHADREITAVYDRYEYDKEKQKAMQIWDRQLTSILTG
jgi:integrase